MSFLFFVFFGVNLLITHNFAPLKTNAASSVSFQADISYGSFAKQKLDLCKPTTISGLLPAVVLIHGGGADKSSFTSICKKLAEKGFVAVAVNYREEPSPSYKVILEDNRLVLKWLKSQNYVNTNKIGAWGGSMGGYVASVHGTYESADKVQCVSNNYGPTDFLDPNLESSPLAEEFETNFFGVSKEENPELYKELSPISHVSSNDAHKWLFTRSTNDTLVPRSQMTRMIRALQNVGIQTEFYEYNGTGSGHANKLGPLQAKRLLDKRLNFMTDCLRSL